MKFVLLLSVPTLLSAATLTITPPVAFDCNNNEAVVTVSWSAASGPVQVVLLKPTGPSFTGLADPSGSAVTGPWVADGLQFYLVDQNGATLASATAHVRCGSTPRTIETGLSAGSYFPLQIGNTWIYRVNSRQITNDYMVRTITGTQVVNGATYYVMTDTYTGSDPVTTLLRGDNNGAIHFLNGNLDQIYLDPAANPNLTSFLGPLGTFNNSLTVTQNAGSLLSNSSTFSRGIGLVSLQQQMLSGSSGGFTLGLDLVEARIDGIALALPAGGKLSVSIDTPQLDLTNQKAPNCAIPLYCAACGLLGADPSGTYRPCVQTRVETSFLGPHSIQLQFFNPSGTLVYTTTADIAGTGTLRYLRLPLYTAQAGTGPFQILPGGIYKVVGRMIASGVEVGVDSLTVVLQ